MATVASLDVRLGADISGALAGLQKINRSVSSATGFFDRAAATAAGFIGGALGLAGLLGISSAATDAIFGFNASLEQSRTSFGVMLGSGAKANAFLGQLQSFALATPFEFPQLVSASQRMLAFGFAADQVIPLLTDIGNAASASPSGFAQGLDRISLALGQMQAKGRVQGDELLQLQEAGINTGQVFAIMAQQTGKPVAALRKLQTEGKISSATFIKAFQTFSQARFGGLMEKQSQTFTGAVSNIKDGLRGALAQGFLPLFEAVRRGAVRLADFLQTAQFQAWVASLSAAVSRVVTWFGAQLPAAWDQARGVFQWLLANGPKAWEWLQVAGAFVQQHAQPILAFLAGFGGTTAAAAAGAAIFSGLVGALTALLSPVVLIGVAVGLLAAAWTSNWGGIRDTLTAFWTGTALPVLTELWTWLSVNVPAALTAVSGFWTGTLQPALESVWGFLSTNVLPILSGLANVGLAIAGKEVEAFAALWTGVLLPALQGVASFLSTTVLPVLQGIWNWFATKLAPVFAAVGQAAKTVGGAAPAWLNSLAASVSAVPVGPLPAPGQIGPPGGVDNSLVVQITGPVNASTPEDRAALARAIVQARDESAGAATAATMPEGA